MQNMVYVALSILAVATLILFVWMLHAAWHKKLGAVFANLGLFSVIAYAFVVLAGVGTATGSAISASFTVAVGTWALLALGGVSLVLSVTITGVLRSMQAWRVRRDNAKARRLDKRERGRQSSTQFVDDMSRT